MSATVTLDASADVVLLPSAHDLADDERVQLDAACTRLDIARARGLDLDAEVAREARHLAVALGGTRSGWAALLAALPHPED